MLLLWEESMEAAYKCSDQYDEVFQQMEQQNSRRADDICAEIRNIETENDKALKKMKTDQFNKLQEQTKCLTDRIEGIKQNIKNLEDILRSNEIQGILEFSQDEEEAKQSVLPQVNEPPTLTFEPIDVDFQALSGVYGQLKISDTYSITDEAEAGTSAVGATKEMPTDRSRRATLMPKPVLVSSFEIEQSRFPPSIACVKDQHAWVRTSLTKLQLVSRNGTVKDTVRLDTVQQLGDISLAPENTILISDFDANCITIALSDGRIEIQFGTASRPWGVCHLHNGNVAVTFLEARKVICYTFYGTKLWEVSCDNYPWSLAENKANKDIFVCVKSDLGHTYASGQIIALSEQGEQKFTYKGQGQSADFTPVHVCSDFTGHVLITDYSQHRIHILDQDGGFLQFIEFVGEDKLYPFTIDVDSEGFAWISEFMKDKVRVVKYLEYSAE